MKTGKMPAYRALQLHVECIGRREPPAEMRGCRVRTIQIVTDPGLFNERALRQGSLIWQSEGLARIIDRSPIRESANLEQVIHRAEISGIAVEANIRDLHLIVGLLPSK